MIVFPNAKINLGLFVRDPRADGYHNLETIFLPINIKDILEFVESSTLSFSSSGLSIPGDTGDNLCLRAYHIMSKDMKIPKVHIHLHKNIPIGAGLGGGSSDAAFLIKLLNKKFTLDLSLDQMEYYARRLGADCSFFIRNKAVLATERGDVFHPINLELKNYCIILVVPSVHISTQEAYDGIIPEAQEQSLKEAILLPIEAWRDSIKNSFEVSLFKKHPMIADIKTALYEAGALYASMSGSGSAVYGIFKDRVQLIKLEADYSVFYDVGL